jgi:hypothetical protein
VLGSISQWTVSLLVRKMRYRLLRNGSLGIKSTCPGESDFRAALSPKSATTNAVCVDDDSELVTVREATH